MSVATRTGRAGFCTAMAACLLIGGCATSPYDIPLPTMIGNEQGVAMTGVMAESDEAEVRRRLAKRMYCPDFDIVSLKTEPASNKLGTKMLYYNAIMKCRTPDAGQKQADEGVDR